MEQVKAPVSGNTNNLSSYTQNTTNSSAVSTTGLSKGQKIILQGISQANKLSEFMKSYEQNKSDVEVIDLSDNSSLENLDVIVKEVINGKWGNGEERRQKLEEAGYNYEEIQNKVNESLGVNLSQNIDVSTSSTTESTSSSETSNVTIENPFTSPEGHELYNSEMKSDTSTNANIENINDFVDASAGSGTLFN